MKSIAEKITSEHRGLVIAAVSIVVFALLLGATVMNNRQTSLQRQQIQTEYVHTLQVILVAEKLKSAISAALRGQRGFLLTGEAEFLRPFRERRATAEHLTQSLAKLTVDNPVQRDNISRLKREKERFFVSLARSITLAQAGQTGAKDRLLAARVGRARTEAILTVLDVIEAEERRLLTLRGSAYNRLEDKMAMNENILSLIGLVYVVIAGYSTWIAHRSERHAHAAADAMKKMAMTDALTGVANRRAFFETLTAEVRKSALFSQPLTLAVMDIDYFKRINDNYGHPAGDDVLQVAARLALDEMRTGDLVGRIGGEEFAVLMPGTSERDAHLACERLRQALERRIIALPDERGISITLSMGLAELVPGESGETLFARADAALFQAKAGGRNQIRLAA